jgi:hypothetical protein
VEDAVLGVDRQEAEDRLVAADDEAPNRNDDVDDAEDEGVGPRGARAGGESRQTEDAAEDVNGLCQALTSRMPSTASVLPGLPKEAL